MPHSLSVEQDEGQLVGPPASQTPLMQAVLWLGQDRHSVSAEQEEGHCGGLWHVPLTQDVRPAHKPHCVSLTQEAGQLLEGLLHRLLMHWVRPLGQGAHWSLLLHCTGQVCVELVHRPLTQEVRPAGQFWQSPSVWQDDGQVLGGIPHFPFTQKVSPLLHDAHSLLLLHDDGQLVSSFFLSQTPSTQNVLLSGQL